MPMCSLERTFMRFSSAKLPKTAPLYITRVTDQSTSRTPARKLNLSHVPQRSINKRRGYNVHGALLAALLLSTVLGALSSTPARASITIEIGVVEDGRYQISFEDVEHLIAPVSESRLRLLEQGVDIPFSLVSADHISVVVTKSSSMEDGLLPIAAGLANMPVTTSTN